MNWKRFIKIRDMKNEISIVNGQIQDDMLLLAGINVLAFLTIVGSISATLILELSTLPIISLVGVNIITLYALKKANESIKKEMSPLFRERADMKNELYCYKKGISLKRYKTIKPEVKISDRELRSYIDTKTVREIYESSKKRKIKKNDEVVYNKLIISQKMIKDICDLLEEDRKKYSLIFEGSVSPETQAKMNDIFNENSEVVTKSDLKKSGYVKRMH